MIKSMEHMKHVSNLVDNANFLYEISNNVKLIEKVINANWRDMTHRNLSEFISLEIEPLIQCFILKKSSLKSFLAIYRRINNNYNK